MPWVRCSIDSVLFVVLGKRPAVCFHDDRKCQGAQTLPPPAVTPKQVGRLKQAKRRLKEFCLDAVAAKAMRRAMTKIPIPPVQIDQAIGREPETVSKCDVAFTTIANGTFHWRPFLRGFGIPLLLHGCRRNVDLRIGNVAKEQIGSRADDVVSVHPAENERPLALDSR